MGAELALSPGPLALHANSIIRTVLAEGSLNRNSGLNLLGAEASEFDGIRQWVAQQASPRTSEAYLAEVERLLLWTALVRKKPLADLLLPDFQAYQAFLREPPATWCGPIRPKVLARDRMKRLADRGSASLGPAEQTQLHLALERYPELDPVPNPLWRPFQGPQKESKLRRSMLILRSLWDFLVAAGVLRANPLTLVNVRTAGSMGERPDNVRTNDPRDRALDHVELNAVREAIEALPVETREQRDTYEQARYLLEAYYTFGARLSELVLHSQGSLRNTRDGWIWYVTGKGGKDSELTATDAFMHALQRYRMYRGLPPLPSPEERTPFVLAKKRLRAISARQVHNILKDLFRAAADLMEERREPERAKRLRSASTHWLRHSFVTHLSEKVDDPFVLQDMARHGSFDTTRRYIRRDRTAKRQALAFLDAPLPAKTDDD